MASSEESKCLGDVQCQAKNTVLYQIRGRSSGFWEEKECSAECFRVLSENQAPAAIANFDLPVYFYRRLQKKNAHFNRKTANKLMTIDTVTL